MASMAAVLPAVAAATKALVVEQPIFVPRQQSMSESQLLPAAEAVVVLAAARAVQPVALPEATE